MTLGLQYSLDVLQRDRLYARQKSGFDIILLWQRRKELGLAHVYGLHLVWDRAKLARVRERNGPLIEIVDAFPHLFTIPAGN